MTENINACSQLRVIFVRLSNSAILRFLSMGKLSVDTFFIMTLFQLKC